MCIIAYYERGKRPDKNTVNIMIENNPDGVGFAWNDGRKVHFEKGYKTLTAVLTALAKIPSTAKDIVFHARISTSGGISAEKCHPFPIAQSEKKLNATKGISARPLVFHNGVFPITPAKGLNDTQTFTRDCLAPLYLRDATGVKYGLYDDLIELATRGSRLVIMYPDEVRIFGSGWKLADDGVMYSNDSYQKPRYTYWCKNYNTYGYGKQYDDDYWEKWEAEYKNKYKGGTANNEKLNKTEDVVYSR